MEFIFEILLQLVFELFFGNVVRFLREPFRKVISPWFAMAGYAIYGTLSGALSLWIFPSLFMASHPAQVANLLITPFLMGGAMMALGAWRRSRHKEVIRLDRFLYGFVFAAAMAAVRFSFGD